MQERTIFLVDMLTYVDMVYFCDVNICTMTGELGDQNYRSARDPNCDCTTMISVKENWISSDALIQTHRHTQCVALFKTIGVRNGTSEFLRAKHCEISVQRT